MEEQNIENPISNAKTEPTITTGINEAARTKIHAPVFNGQHVSIIAAWYSHSISPIILNRLYVQVVILVIVL